MAPKREIVWIGLRPGGKVDVQVAIATEITPAKRATRNSPAVAAQVEYAAHQTITLNLDEHQDLLDEADALRQAVAKALGVKAR